MANTLTAVTPKLLAQGLLALRENAITPRLVNRGYETLAGQRGSTIDVPVPQTIAVQTVSPAATPPSTATITPTSVPIALDQWKEAPFYLTDKDILEAMNGIIPMQASEAIKALGNNIDQFILGLYPKFYGYFGTAGTTPFGSTPGVKDATGIRKVLNEQLAPLNDRHAVLDPAAEAAALGLKEFADSNFSGSVEAMLEGMLNRKLGFQWWMDQNVPTHTAGTGDSATTDATGYAIGLKTVALASAGTGTILVGDIITFAGDTQTYVITSGDADVSDGGSISFEPGLQIALGAGAVAITLKATHVVNLAFQRNAIAFASRPLEQDTEGLGSITRSVVDPVTGIALRLEVTREHKRTRFAYDVLYGAQVVRRELGARLAG